MRSIVFLICGCLLFSGCQNSDTELADQTPTIAPIAALPDGIMQDAEPTPSRPNDIDLTDESKAVRSRVIPTIIDTRSFQPQIQNAEPWQGEIRNSSIFRPEKTGKPEIPNGPENNLRTGQIAEMSRVIPGPLFPGIAQSPWTPPDPTLAVGPNHIIETVNMELAFFTKDGTQTFQQRLDSSGSPGFFAEVGSGNFTFDPKCFYDHYSNRFVVLALEVYDNIQEAWITFAVSDDDDPNGIWYKYRTWAVITVDASTYWVDYPGFGYDQTGFYVTGNLFGLNTSGFGGAVFRSFEKTPLLQGDPAEFNDVRRGSAGSVQAAQCFGPNLAPFFVYRQSSSQLRIAAIVDPHGPNPNYEQVTVSVPSGSSPPNAPNAGGTLNVVGSRIMNVHYRDGRLWTCNAVDVGNRAVARWYEFEMGNWPISGNPTLVQSGDIDLGGSNHTFFPAVYTNSDGSAAIVVGKSSSAEFASVMAAGRMETDPLGTMSIPVELSIGDSGANGRWGDYFDIAVDPQDDRKFWMVGQYQNASGWQTTIHSFDVQTMVDVDAQNLNVVRGSNPQGTVAATFDSDDTRFQISSEPQSSNVDPGVWLEFTSILPSDQPSALEFLIESGAATSGLELEVALFDYDSVSYEIVSTVGQQIADATTEVTASGDVTRFVEAGTGEVKARIRYSAVAPVLMFPWSISIDEIRWTSTQ